MELIAKQVNICKAMVLSFYLLNTFHVTAMDCDKAGSYLVKTLERIYYTQYSRDSKGVMFIPYDLSTQTVKGNDFADKIYEGLTAEEKSVSMVLLGYPHGEEVVLNRSVLQKEPIRSFSVKEINDMRYIRVVVFPKTAFEK